MHAIPQPSGWPGFGSGCGQPKSFGVRPKSPRPRNAVRSAGGIARSAFAARILDMSAQLVPDLPEELDPGRPVRFGLNPLGTFAVNHPDNSPPAGVLCDEHVDRIRRRAEYRNDLRSVPNRAEDVEGVYVPEEDDERVSSADRESIPPREILQARVVPLDAHEARPARLAKR